MDLKDPATLAGAWVLTPLLVLVVVAGLGAGVSALSGLRLGALAVPAGYLAGLALITAGLEVGLSGKAVVVTVVVLAAAGAVGPRLLRTRPARRGARGSLRVSAEARWAALGGLAAYAIVMAPLVLSGRSGILGYVLNNDPAAHVPLVELLADNGAEPVAVDADSYHVTSAEFDSGYPLGTYAWPLVGRVVSGLDPFHLWTPLIALSVAVLALVTFHLLRTLDAPPAFAAGAGALAAASYLPLSYAVQGGAKELLIPVTVVGTVAFGVRALEGPVTWRTLLPAAIGAAATVANLGYAGLAWLGPAGLALLVVLAIRARRRRSLGELRAAAVGGALALLVALPSGLESVSFIRDARVDLARPGGEAIATIEEVGNLFGALPLRETLPVWLAGDYRLEEPTLATITAIGTLLALAAALAGLAYALRRRAAAPLAAVATVVVGAALVYPRVSIYFEAKTLVAVAPVVAVLAAAGVLWLVRRGGRARPAGIVAGALLAAGAIASSGFVYRDVLITPEERFEELAQIGDRFAGQGPMLVNDREYYAAHLLRDAGPWDDWSERQPFVGIPYPFVLGPQHTPDFDDYSAEHVRRFRLLLERRRPGGSRPPASFAPVFETPHYRVWRRAGPDAREHLALGTARGPAGGPVAGARPLDCGTSEVRRLIRSARAAGQPLVLSLPRARPVEAIPWNRWVAIDHPRRPLPPPPLFVARRGGVASGQVRLAAGEYVAYLQGSHATGVRLWVDGQPVGDVLNDWGLPSQWTTAGRFRASRRAPTRLTLVPLDRPRWMPALAREELTGRLLVERVDADPRLVRVAPGGLRRYCRRPVDWIELPA